MECGESEPERCIYRYCDAGLDECAEFDCSAEGKPPCNGDPCLSEDPCVFRYCDPIANECRPRLIENCIPTSPPVESPIPLLLPPPNIPVPAPGGQPITILFTHPAGPGLLVTNFAAVPRSIPLPLARRGAENGLHSSAASNDSGLGPLLVTDPAVFWYVAFEGPVEFPLDVIFQYDPAYLHPGTPEDHFEIFRWNGDTWVLTDGDVDPTSHTITVTVYELSLFALGSSRLFDDDFESGDTSLWTESGPQP